MNDDFAPLKELAPLVGVRKESLARWCRNGMPHKMVRVQHPTGRRGSRLSYFARPSEVVEWSKFGDRSHSGPEASADRELIDALHGAAVRGRLPDDDSNWTMEPNNRVVRLAI